MLSKRYESKIPQVSWPKRSVCPSAHLMMTPLLCFIKLWKERKEVKITCYLECLCLWLLHKIIDLFHTSIKIAATASIFCLYSQYHGGRLDTDTDLWTILPTLVSVTIHMQYTCIILISSWCVVHVTLSLFSVGPHPMSKSGWHLWRMWLVR